MNWKIVRLTLTGLTLVAGLGCGGISGTHTITPASFFLPGLGYVAPVSTNAPTHSFAAIQ